MLRIYYFQSLLNDKKKLYFSSLIRYFRESYLIKDIKRRTFIRTSAGIGTGAAHTIAGCQNLNGSSSSASDAGKNDMVALMGGGGYTG